MRTVKLAIAALLVIVISIGLGVDWSRTDSRVRQFWQQAVIPGALSKSHAFLSNNCAACHTPVKGVEATSCVTCHANNTALLQRQPTAFHANIKVCSGCHVEHQGTVRMPTTMDHALLAEISHEEMKSSGLNRDDLAAASTFLEGDARAPAQGGARGGRNTEGCGDANGCSESAVTLLPPNATKLPLDHQRMAADESMLDCVGCHATKDRHQGFFGPDCVQCHVTTQWSVAKFVHPSPRSTECAQCHKPPPSHTMMHFPMMSARIARQPGAKVNQCYLCHQTTSWNDIKGVGWTKHH